MEVAFEAGFRQGALECAHWARLVLASTRKMRADPFYKPEDYRLKGIEDIMEVAERSFTVLGHFGNSTFKFKD
jgi:hypothetical protein